jgi:hypothetical protein
MSKIREAYDNFIAGGATNFELQPAGKYAITGLIVEGIEVEMFITKNGQMVTGYPIL